MSAFETIQIFALAAANAIAPELSHREDHKQIANAIAIVITSSPPLFRDDESKLRTAALFISIGYREGSLRARVVGDCTESNPGEKCKGRPRSFCFLQIHESNGGSPAMNDDLTLCVRASYALLRTSFKVCPAWPIAHYAEGGEKACSSRRAQRISNDRVALAKRIYEKVFVTNRGK